MGKTNKIIIFPFQLSFCFHHYIHAWAYNKCEVLGGTYERHRFLINIYDSAYEQRNRKVITQYFISFIYFSFKCVTCNRAIEESFTYWRCLLYRQKEAWYLQKPRTLYHPIGACCVAFTVCYVTLLVQKFINLNSCFECSMGSNKYASLWAAKIDTTWALSITSRPRNIFC